MKKIYTFILKVVILFFLIITCLFLLENTFIRKDVNFGTLSWSNFYPIKKNSLDIMFFGNSHIYNGISGKVIDANLNTKSYTISSGGQTIYQTYFNIKEALEFQNPKLIVVETYSFQEKNITLENLRKTESESTNKSKLSSIIKKRFSLNKFIEANTLYDKDKVGIFFSVVRNHSEWKNINDSNSKGQNEINYNGNFFHKKILTIDKLQSYSSGSVNPLSKNFEITFDEKVYLNKIIDLCRKKNVGILFLTIPILPEYLSTFEEEYKTHKENLVGFLKKKEVKLLDLNLKHDKFDYTNFANDNVGRNQHLNYKGAIKSSLNFVEYIKVNFPEVLNPKSKDSNFVEHLIYNNKFNYNPDNLFKVYVGKTTILNNKNGIDKTLEINGWMIVKGEQSTLTEKYVCLVNNKYKYINLDNQITKNLPRKEVSKRFNKENLYDLCGFKVKINTKLLDKGEYKLVLISKDQNDVFRSKTINKSIIIE
ncbi:hypothetical protein [Urechidicola croceus]|uniref:SGNH/GDSL hydrolase family protein n=1 Tax=Urechidicola croceus TaxID=1850246 RepID=A0A1D8P9B5_9FLAO|nr:hypothetical protein [Urechidicola croceus]AOW21162.1 hypothetical protein LPB138_10945 [Urechidicola croceus]